MGRVTIRLAPDEEKIVRAAAAVAKIPCSELIKRRLFSGAVEGQGVDNLRPEIEAIAATLADVASVIADQTRQLRYSQGLSIAVLQIANPEGWKDDMQRMKALAFDDEKEAGK